MTGPGERTVVFTVALGSGDLSALNAHIQAGLIRTRPYGGTPIASALEDLRYYFENSREIAGVPVERRHVVLITDGLPDDDYRQYGCDCTHNDPEGDPATYCGPPRPLTDPAKMRCPYPKAEDAARYLVGAPADRSASIGPGPVVLVRRIASFSVVGLAIDDPTLEEELDAIARAGGADGARFAPDGPALRTELTALLDGILGEPGGS